MTSCWTALLSGQWPHGASASAQCQDLLHLDPHGMGSCSRPTCEGRRQGSGRLGRSWQSVGAGGTGTLAL